MGNLISYGDFTADVYFDKTDSVYVGTIKNIPDFVSFHAEYACDITDKFAEAVNHYFEIRKKIGDLPQK